MKRSGKLFHEKTEKCSKLAPKSTGKIVPIPKSPNPKSQITNAGLSPSLSLSVLYQSTISKTFIFHWPISFPHSLSLGPLPSNFPKNHCRLSLALYPPNLFSFDFSNSCWLWWILTQSHEVAPDFVDCMLSRLKDCRTIITHSIVFEIRGMLIYSLILKLLILGIFNANRLVLNLCSTYMYISICIWDMVQLSFFFLVKFGSCFLISYARC